MSVEKEHGMFIIQCDDCDEVLETETDDIEEANRVAVSNGWSVEGKFHYCEQCTEDHENE